MKYIVYKCEIVSHTLRKPDRAASTNMSTPHRQRGGLTPEVCCPDLVTGQAAQALLSNGRPLSQACLSKINFDKPGSTDKHSVSSDHQNMTKRR